LVALTILQGEIECINGIGSHALHQTRKTICGKFIFHVELDREFLKKCSAILVVLSTSIGTNSTQKNLIPGISSGCHHIKPSVSS
jgi:hypothetical protein